MKEARPIPKMEAEKRIIRGQATYISGRSPLRCYYYAKLGPKWNRADSVVYGMRWNAYMSRGKATPFFHPLEPDTLAHSAPKMRCVSLEEEKKWSLKRERLEPHHSRKETPRKEEARGARGPEAAASPKAHEPAPDRLPMTDHAGFGHTGLVSSPTTEPVAVPLIRMGEKARPVSEREERPEPRVHAPAAQAPITFAATAQFSLGSSGAGEEGIAPPARQETGRAAAFMPTDRISASFAMIGEVGPHPAIAPAEKTRSVQRAGPARALFSIVLRMPQNDNARPGGFDDQRMPAPGFTPQVFFCAAPLQVGREIGYISSWRRRILQLKTAIGAAAPPQ